MNYTTIIEGHTIEIKGSGSGSLDPWTSEYAREKGIGLMCTSDMAEFILLDGDDVWKIRNWGVKVPEMKTWNEVEQFLGEHCTHYGSLKEMKLRIKGMKKKKNGK